MNESQLIEKLLDVPSSFLVGSRGLELDNCNDWDIAMLRSEFTSSNFQSAQLLEMKRYMDVLPIGNNYIAVFKGVDVLLFEDQEALDHIAEAIEIMKCIPKSVLNIKHMRIMIFETLLLDHKIFYDSRKSSGFDNNIPF